MKLNENKARLAVGMLLRANANHDYEGQHFIMKLYIYTASIYSFSIDGLLVKDTSWDHSNIEAEYGYIR